MVLVVCLLEVAKNLFSRVLRKAVHRNMYTSHSLRGMQEKLLASGSLWLTHTREAEHAERSGDEEADCSMVSGHQGSRVPFRSLLREHMRTLPSAVSLQCLLLTKFNIPLVGKGNIFKGPVSIFA